MFTQLSAKQVVDLWAVVEDRIKDLTEPQQKKIKAIVEGQLKSNPGRIPNVNGIINLVIHN